MHIIRDERVGQMLKRLHIMRLGWVLIGKEIGQEWITPGVTIPRHLCVRPLCSRGSGHGL